MDGFINVNKPKGFTSHDVVNVVRRSFRGQKVGHTGTLDPGATGVLPVCIGKATKMQDYIMAARKVYRCDILFGLDSDTLDCDGEILRRDPGFRLDPEALKTVLSAFTGEIEQVPPMVSAVKVNGVPLYKLARKGLEVERRRRRVCIYGIKVLEVAADLPQPQITLEITCSKGTYIRALARDIGAVLGTCAIVSNLVRLATGAFTIGDSLTLEEISERVAAGDFSFLLPLKAAAPQLPVLRIRDVGEIKALLSGNLLPGYRDLESGAVYFLEDVAETPLALAHFEPDLGLKPDKVLFSSAEESKVKPGFRVVGHGGGWGPTAIALGNFDGVHLGHQMLIRAMRRGAQARNLAALVLTFEPHPRAFFHPQGVYATLQSQEAKTAHVAALGVDVLSYYPFDDRLARKTPAAFVDEVLLGEFHAKEIYVGYNFTFGHQGSGDTVWLQEYCAQKGIVVHVVEEIVCGDAAVSSSRIKAALAAGDVVLANRLLGYRFAVRGPVVPGRQLGRTLGFPTVNLDISPGQILPAPGVYTFWVYGEDGVFAGVGNVGNRPTVGPDLPTTVEVYLLDCDLNLYGKILTAAFVARLRGEKDFGSLDELKAQMERDKTEAEEIFKISSGRR